MAVPFVMPEEQTTDAEIELIITQLHILLNRLQALLRRIPNQSSDSLNVPNRWRVRSSARARMREEPMPSTSSANQHLSPPANIPDLLSNLAMIAAATNDAVVATSSHHNYPNPIRSMRRRTSSESSNCEETKISITAVVNHSVGPWNQVGVNLPKIPEGVHTALLTQHDENSPTNSSNKLFPGDGGFLSKLVPGPASAPLWTAMICFVGWHLFKAR